MYCSNLFQYFFSIYYGPYFSWKFLVYNDRNTSSYTKKLE